MTNRCNLWPLRQSGKQRLALVIALGAIVAGCASPGPTGAKPSTKSSQPNILDRADGPLNKPAGISQSMQVVAGLLPLGAVPYDNASLPLISPDGRFVAVQTGAPPTWPTVLAEPDSEIPAATRIEIYEIDWRSDIDPAQRTPPTLVATLNEPLILGRFSDSQGFLVESAREDGSRWIGKVAWESPHIGALSWLVSDQNINAFAAIGHGDSLAWCRRTRDATTFELVVRMQGAEYVVAPLPQSTPVKQEENEFEDLGEDVAARKATSCDGWLMPTWSSHATGSSNLFALYLGNGELSFRHMIATSAAAAHQSMRRLMLASNCDIHSAYQAVSAQPSTIIDIPSAVTSDQIVFFHPRLGRAALWRPLALADRQRTQLNPFSITAFIDQDEFAFVTTTRSPPGTSFSGGQLVRQNLRKPDERIHLVAGIQIVRQIASPSWPYVLINPDEGKIALAAMKLLPKEQSPLAGP